MTIVVFVGPTIGREEAEALLPARYLPPASLGDVYSAARARPRAIAIIDGYFDRVPAVWHKEILWALSRGIHVFGCSSMGALRAAELERFGMVGVGRVFEAFRNGSLEDDDEVAILHGPSEGGYIAGSEALVDMRATLAAARDSGVISNPIHDLLVQIAKRTHYRDRSYARLLRDGPAAGVPASGCEALRRWLPGGRIRLKHDDAVALLTRLRQEIDEVAEPKQVGFSFHDTIMWEELRNTIERRPLQDFPGAERAGEDDLVDELRLEGESYRRVRDRALVRMLAIELGNQLGDDPGSELEAAAAADARQAAGLGSAVELEPWLVRQQLTPRGYARLLQDEALFRSVWNRYHTRFPMYLRDYLRVIGQYGPLHQRARDKQEALARWGLEDPGLGDAGIPESELWRWFFETVQGQEVPEDIAAYAVRLDFPDLDVMRRAVLREFLFRKKRRMTGPSVLGAGARGDPEPV